MTTDTVLAQRQAAEQQTLREVRQALCEELQRRGIGFGRLTVPEQLTFCEIRRDKFDASEAFYGEWRQQGRSCGSVIVHASGELFAEFDVLLPHPTDKRWFVEAVTAWGRPGAVKAELRLLPALAE